VSQSKGQLAPSAPDKMQFMVRIMFLMYGNYNYNIKKLEIIGSGGGTKMGAYAVQEKVAIDRTVKPSL